MGDDLSSREPTSAQLLVLAASAGHDVNERTLELWRYRGLLPRPSRARGAWTYPAGTERQLLALLRWREQTRSLELIRIALWVRGFPIELESVRGALRQFVAAWAEAFERERHAAGLDSTDDLPGAVDALARRLASMRSKAPVAKAVRMTVAERSRAYGYIVALMFGLSDELERRNDDWPLVERMVGFRRGRGGGLAAALEPGALKPIMPFPTMAEAEAAVDNASAEEYEFVRRLLHLMITWTPMLLRLAVTTEGDRARDFVAIASRFAQDPPVSIYAPAVLFHLVALHRKEPTGAELREHVSALDPEQVNQELASLLPPELLAEFGPPED